jgi:ABC-type sugar transport system ATPase subunit
VNETHPAADGLATVTSARMPPAASFEAQPAGAILATRHLAKSFGATRALRSCSFELRFGEVHAIVGENGSGKSTFVKILAGVQRADGGQVSIAGSAGAHWRSPCDAQQAGIFTVFQEVLVVGAQSVVENVWLGADGLFRRQLSTSEKRQRATDVLAALLGAAPDLDTPAGSLTLGQRQACCIARALVRDPRVLILDESTSALDIATRDRLFAIVRQRCGAGVGVIFISHRMDEIQELADRTTVLRSGESVATLEPVQATPDVLVRHMTGADHLTAGVKTVAARTRVRGEILLRAERLTLAPEAEPIDFALHAGELVGLAGLEGHGQAAFLRALAGAGAMGGRVVCGQRAVSSPTDAFAAGVAYLPRERAREGIFPTLSIAENFALATLDRDRRMGVIRRSAAARRLSVYVQQLGIRMASPRQPITALSGGNQQKVIVARWLAAQPRVLLLNDPTRGVDVAAKRDLYGLLERLAADGVGVVMLSSEVDEHVELLDRVLVFREKSVFGELPRERLTRTSLTTAFFGRDETARH